MYTDEDISKAKSAMIKRVIGGSALILVIAAALIVFTKLRMLALSMAVCSVLFCLTLFVWMTKIMPHIRYNILLRDMCRGRHRETECTFVSVSDETVTRDGVEVHEMIVRVDDTEDGERLFFWDDDKALPAFGAGQPIRIESFGNYVIDCVTI